MGRPGRRQQQREGGEIVADSSGVYVTGAYPNGGGNTDNDFDPGSGVYSLPGTFAGEALTGGVFLLKLNTNNQFQWVKGLVGNSTSGGETPGQLTLDGAGSVYVSGAISGTRYDFDIEHSYPGDIDRVDLATYQDRTFVAKYSSGGAFRWAATVAGGANPLGLAVTTDGGVHFALGATVGTTLTVSPGEPGEAQFTIGYNASMLELNFAQTADPVMLYVKQVYQAEGNSGTKAFTFQVFLSDPLDYPLVVNYSTADGTATASSGDYTARIGGTVTFLAGQTQATVSVPVTGDGTSEPDETFALDLWSGLGGAALRGWATIANDDTTGGGKKK